MKLKFKPNRHRNEWPFPRMYRDDYLIVAKRFAHRAAAAAYMYGHRHPKRRLTCHKFGTQGRVRITMVGGKQLWDGGKEL